VLVIDDDVALSRIVQKMLAVDFDVEVVNSGQEAVARLSEGNYDLVLSDVTMPGLDGPTVFELATRNRPELASRFVFMTGGVSTLSAREFLEASEAPVVGKPFTSETLRSILRKRVDLVDSSRS
jgi:CheY-like chemotaxis protein